MKEVLTIVKGLPHTTHTILTAFWELIPAVSLQDTFI